MERVSERRIVVHSARDDEEDDEDDDNAAAGSFPGGVAVKVSRQLLFVSALHPQRYDGPFLQSPCDRKTWSAPSSPNKSSQHRWALGEERCPPAYSFDAPCAGPRPYATDVVSFCSVVDYLCLHARMPAAARALNRPDVVVSVLYVRRNALLCLTFPTYLHNRWAGDEPATARWTTPPAGTHTVERPRWAHAAHNLSDAFGLKAENARGKRRAVLHMPAFQKVRAPPRRQRHPSG